MIQVTITWETLPGSIADVLGRKLGRAPTNAELKAEVQRIMDESLVAEATQGKLPHQR